MVSKIEHSIEKELERDKMKDEEKSGKQSIRIENKFKGFLKER